MRPRAQIGIQTLLLRTFLPAVLVAALLLATLVYTMLYDTVLRQFDGRLVATSAITGALIDPADHDWLIGEARAGSDPAAVEADPRYRRNVEPMRRIRAKLGLTYVYTQVRGGPEDVLYILDGTDGEEHTAIGSPDSLPAETMAGLRKVQTERGLYVSPVEYQEQWGLLKTAAAPVYSTDGRVAGTAGADVNVSVIKVATQNALFQSAMIGVASIIICLIVTLQVVRRIARPIERLTQEALRIAAGDHGPPAAIHHPREVGALRDSLALLGVHVTGEIDNGATEAAHHRLAESEKRLLVSLDADARPVVLADGPERRLIWVATGDAGLTAALAARAMSRLGERAKDRPEWIDRLDALADLDQGALLSFEPGTRSLTLTAAAPLTFDVDGGSLILEPGEAVTLPPGPTRLRYRGDVLPFAGAGS